MNPCASDRVPGGSSSGSAVAVGAGLVDFSLGQFTDDCNCNEQILALPLAYNLFCHLVSNGQILFELLF